MPGLLRSESALQLHAKQAEEETIEPNREPFKTPDCSVRSPVLVP